MPIQDQYIGAIRRMESRFGRDPGGPVIPKEATLKRCIDYAARYLYEGDTEPDYRYKRYMQALESLIGIYDVYRKTTTIVHMDIGCGPGLFSWVVHDYFKHREPKMAIKLHAYDHSPEMVRLAGLLWGKFETGIGLDTTSDLDALISRVLISRITQGGPPADMIVSFGHVLAQASSQKNAIAVFADTLSRIRLNSSLVVAVDAKSADQNFRLSIGRLVKVLADHGLAFRPCFLHRGDMIGMVTGCRSEERT